MIENENLARRKKVVQWVLAGLPLAAIVVSAFLPLRDAIRQAFIGIILIWFQASLMFGTFG